MLTSGSKGEQKVSPKLNLNPFQPGRSVCEFPTLWNPTTQRIECLRRSSLGERHSYREIRQIGSGGFGNCFLLERKTDKALRVCKVQARETLPGDEEFDQALIEVSILRDLLPKHDRILRLHECLIQPYTVQLYYDFYEAGDLGQLISRYFEQWQDIPETFLWHAYTQMSEALAFLHFGHDRRQLFPGPGEWIAVIHGDIKDQNIFLGPPDPSSHDLLAREYPSLVLGDFGMADIQPSNRWSTPRWQPPELPVTSMKADVWGIGAVVHALAHEGKAPISASPPRLENLSWDEWCRDPRSRDPIPLYEKYSNELHDCVFNALEFDPMRRYNSNELYFKVSGIWRDSMAQRCGAIIPLIPALGNKSYDDNGVTMNKKDSEMDVEQKCAASSALQLWSFSKDQNVTKHSHNMAHSFANDSPIRHQPLTTPTRRGSGGPSVSAEAFIEIQGTRESVILTGNLIARHAMQDQRAWDFANQRNWLSPEELMIMEEQGLIPPPPPPLIEMEDVRPPSPLSSATIDAYSYYDDALAFENVVNRINVEAIAAIVHDECMACNEESFSDTMDDVPDQDSSTWNLDQIKQLHTAPSGTPAGTNLDMNLHSCFSDLGQEMSDFIATSEEEHGANPSSWYIGHIA